jgi:hypothetical protein
LGEIIDEKEGQEAGFLNFFVKRDEKIWGPGKIWGDFELDMEERDTQ